MELILASQSPRRRELMNLVATAFTCQTSQADETLPPDTPPEKAVETLALRKALAVRAQLPEPENRVVIGSDTVVAIDGRVLGKPWDREDCLEMLRSLSGREHTVHTGAALVWGERTRVFRETARVTFWPLTPGELAWYAGTPEPYDKAGGYGVQGLGALLVREIHGDYYTVMGLPVSRLWRELAAFAPGKLPLRGVLEENLRN